MRTLPTAEAAMVLWIDGPTYLDLPPWAGLSRDFDGHFTTRNVPSVWWSGRVLILRPVSARPGEQGPRQVHGRKGTLLPRSVTVLAKP